MLKYRSLIIALILLLMTGGVGYYLYRAERQRQAELTESSRQSLDAEASVLSKGAFPSLNVKLQLYSPGRVDPNSDFLYVQERSIFETDDKVLKARQIVNEVLKSRPLFSDKATLRQIYLLDNGTAIVDLSDEAAKGLTGGITSEMAAILSITRSLRTNIEEIKQVRFLIGGQQTETFAGHVSIQQPFR
ncbi:MAG: GerMN domain-containing protein [Acidobacteriota bacterium]